MNSRSVRGTIGLVDLVPKDQDIGLSLSGFVYEAKFVCLLVQKPSHHCHALSTVDVLTCLFDAQR